MVRPFFKYILWLTLCFVLTKGMAQGGVFSQVTLNKNNVYVGEAVELNIGVYTPTWFTRGVDIGNIKVNGAFSVYFRAVSTNKKVNGKTYAGVQLLYNIFPFEEKDIIIPSLDIEVETPAVGGFKGIKRIIKTKERILKIKPRPPSANKDQWLVTTGMSIKENWSGNINQVKVGEVLERKISRNAYGTVAELIPPIQWDSISAVSIYPSRSTVNTNKGKTSISASRTDGVQYLFEKEGAIDIPEMEFVWWHPYQKKFLKRTLASKQINVLPNPDLKLLKTVKDSLSYEADLPETLETKDAMTFPFGLTAKEFALLLLVLGILLFLLYKGILRFTTYMRAKKKAYEASERYAFQNFIRTLAKKELHDIVPSLYHWIDHLSIDEPTLKEFAKKTKNFELANEIAHLEDHIKLYKQQPLTLDRKIWRKARKQFLKSNENKIKVNQWINP